jgi:transposase
MPRFIEGDERSQSVLFLERLDDWIAEDNPVRVIDVFVDELDLGALGFERSEAAETGRPGYHPATLLKIYVYGYGSGASRHATRPAFQSVARPLDSDLNTPPLMNTCS